MCPSNRMSRCASFALALLLLAGADAGAMTLVATAGGPLSAPIALGHYVYIGTGATLGTWDFADPQAPVIVDRERLAPICGVTITNSYIYTCMHDDRGSGGIWGFGLADPAHPAFLGGFYGGAIEAVAANGTHLYAVDATNVLTVYDIATPWFMIPAPYDSGIIGSSFDSMSLQDGDLLVATSSLTDDQTLTLFDISNATHPQGTAVVSTQFGAYDYAKTHGYLIVLAGSLAIFDARDLAHVTQVFSQAIAPATRIAVDGNVLYLFGGSTLQVWDISTITHPVELPAAPIDTTGTQEIVPVAGGLLALTNTGFATLLDTTHLTQPTVRATFTLPGAVVAPSGASNGAALFLADAYYGLKIDNAVTFAPIASVATGEIGSLGASDVALDGNVAFVVALDGLHAIDVGNPAAPQQRGFLALPFFEKIVIDRGRAYLIAPNQPAPFAIVDVSDPAAMRLLGTLDIDTPHAIAVRGTHAFVATDAGAEDGAGLRVIDVSNAEAPVQVGKYTDCTLDAGGAVDVDAAGTTAYLGCSQSELRVLDVSNPATPALVGAYDLRYPYGGTITAVAARGTTIYVGHPSGVDEVDVSDRTSPTRRTTDETAAPVTAIALSPDGSLYAFAGQAGTYLFAPAPQTSGHSAHERAPRAPSGRR